MSRIDVLVVDDSRLMRRMVGDILAAMPQVGRVAFALDAHSARERLAEQGADVMTLDVEMPDLDGIAFLEEVMRTRPLPVVMVSAITSRGAQATVRALERGAVEVVGKPTGLDGMEVFRRELSAAVRFASAAKVGAARGRPQRAPAPAAAPGPAVEIVAIAASTGGVTALGTVLQGLPRLAPPCLVTQHMPDAFLGRLAQRLAARLDRDVALARQGEVLRQGMIRLAPGHRHVVPVSRHGALSLTLSDAPAPMGHTPSADIMFAAVARLDRPALGIILTGMGRDGAQGLLEMHRAGCRTIGQDRDSCVVYGMPRAAAELGALDQVLAPEGIAAHLSTIWQPSSASVMPSHAGVPDAHGAKHDGPRRR